MVLLWSGTSRPKYGCKATSSGRCMPSGCTLHLFSLLSNVFLKLVYINFRYDNNLLKNRLFIFEFFLFFDLFYTFFNFIKLIVYVFKFFCWSLVFFRNSFLLSLKVYRIYFLIFIYSFQIHSNSYLMLANDTESFL